MNPAELSRLIRLTVVAVAVTAITLIGMVLLPHDRYVLWQSMNTEAYARLGWMYERIHYDTTPVDIAFIGTSHTMNGIDAATLAQDIAAEGVRDPSGRCLTATNFAIPAYGRNLHWLITRELLRTRKVRLLVVEVFENETRKAHPVFSHVADAGDILRAPLLINMNYFPDIARLPYRQLSVAAESVWPEAFGLKRAWSAADYDGSTVDNTRVVNVGGKALSPFRDHQEPPADLQKAAEAHVQTKNPHVLGSRFAELEYNFPLHYLNGILELAKATGTKVVFMYLPGYGQADRPTDMKPYRGYGPMIDANAVLRRNDIWFDDAHLTARGAAELTSAVAPKIAVAVPGAAVNPTPGPCGDRAFGYPTRPSLQPFRTR